LLCLQASQRAEDNCDPQDDRNREPSTAGSHGDSFVESEVVSVGRDYTKFPPLQGTPRSGDNIAYKVTMQCFCTSCNCIFYTLRGLCTSLSQLAGGLNSW